MNVPILHGKTCFHFEPYCQTLSCRRVFSTRLLDRESPGNCCGNHNGHCQPSLQTMCPLKCTRRWCLKPQNKIVVQPSSPRSPAQRCFGSEQKRIRAILYSKRQLFYKNVPQQLKCFVHRSIADFIFNFKQIQSM